MRTLFDRQRAAFERNRYPTHEERVDRLTRLLSMTDKIASAVVDAVSADFGHRTAQTTWLSDIGATVGQIKHNRRHLKKWMRVRRAPTRLVSRPGWSRIMPQPLGVVGVVAPWNYPYLLSIGCSIGAIAAGNRVMIKPSELTPRFSALLAAAVPEFFSPEELTVVIGDSEVGKAFVSLPFDHLIFTGSTEVGRSVARAAAANLTPATLELSGKSPAIINADCKFEEIADRIVMGKMLNCGQSCIAPDYLAVPLGTAETVVAGLQSSIAGMFPRISGNPDYTGIVHDSHVGRLQKLLEDAQANGAKIVPLHAEGLAINETRQMPPVAVLNVNDDMRVMREEIFGPIFPIMTYRSLDEIIAYINRHDRPLSLYWFGRSVADRDKVLRETIAGGVTINDCVWHFGQEDMPFGGVGASGTGQYHGEYGFRTFSKDKPIFFQPRFAGTGVIYPPYGKIYDIVLKVVRAFS